MIMRRSQARRRYLFSGGVPAISVSPSSWDFGSTPVGTPVSEVFTIENTGRANLIISTISVPSGFTLTDPLSFPMTIAPGATDTFTVQADADSVAVFSGNVSISNNSAVNPYEFAITVTVEIAWLFRDEFITIDAAPISSPRTAEPGPGSWTITNGANLSIADGRLVRSATSRMVSVDTYARANLAFYMRYLSTAASSNVGLSANAASVLNGFDLGIFQNTPNVSGTEISLVLDALFPDSYVDLLVITRPSGGAVYYVRGANYARWQLAWVSTAENSTPLYVYANGNASDVGKSDDISLVEAPSTFSGQFSHALHYEASPASGNLNTGSARGIAEITWTPASNETLVMTVNELNADNKIILRCNQAANTITLHRMIAGAETLLQSAAQTWTVGTPYRIVLRNRYYTSGIMLTAIVNNTAKLAPSSGVFPTIEYATNSRVSGFTTASDYALWAGEEALPAPFYESGFSWFWAYGDSKTLARKTQARLTTLLEESTSNRWLYDDRGRSGYTVAQQAALISTDLANVDNSINPSHILINLGSNDAGALPAEATWKANYRTIIETVHVKWPSATIYLAKPVRLAASPPSTPVAAVATMHAWIDDLIAEYAYVEIGLDETQLENGDSYVTYLADFTHPNNAGYARCAELWQTALGL